MVSFIPDEIWAKIDLFIVVDSNRRKLLQDIRKYKIKSNIKEIYLTFWGNPNYDEWLHNDICRWLNNDRASLFGLTPQLHFFFKKAFNISINSNEELDDFEMSLTKRINESSKKKIKNRYDSKFLWNLYADKMSEQELLEFYNWIFKNTENNIQWTNGYAYGYSFFD